SMTHDTDRSAASLAKNIGLQFIDGNNMRGGAGQAHLFLEHALIVGNGKRCTFDFVLQTFTKRPERLRIVDDRNSAHATVPFVERVEKSPHVVRPADENGIVIAGTFG